MVCSGFKSTKKIVSAVLLAAAGVSLLLYSCSPDNGPAPPGDSLLNKIGSVAPVSLDLDKIKQRGTLIALTRFNANSYFLYRGEPLGFEYERLTRLAEHLKRRFRKRLNSPLFTNHTGKLSPFDDQLKKHARTLGWDWRLLAAQVYQESRFDPRKKSWTGARGLLQLMPKTGKRFGAEDLYDPEQNLKAGTSFVGWLTEYWKDIPDPKQRICFVLASYNTGQGHVQDARRLAEKYGKDPDRWNGHTAAFLLKKTGKKFFQTRWFSSGTAGEKSPWRMFRTSSAPVNITASL